MARETKEAHNPSGQFAIQVPISAVPILPPGPGQQGYWMVPLPPAPGALPGQPIQWAPVIAYGRVTSQQASIPLAPPSPANPEWTALAGDGPIPIDEPVLSLPLSPPAAGPLSPVEWQAMVGGPDQGKKYTLFPPLAAGPDSAVGNQGQIPAGLGQGMDWFIVPIPTPPKSEGNGPSDGPNALISPCDDGGPSTKL